jgi:hypothetical protein
LVSSKTHRPELEQPEGAAVQPRTSLAKEHWAARSQANEQRDYQYYRAEQGQANACRGQVKDSLAPALVEFVWGLQGIPYFKKRTFEN